MTYTARRRWTGLAVLVAVAVAAGLLRLVVDRPPGGSLSFAWPEPAWAELRWHALLVGAIVGAGLAVSGTLLQSLLRNPLASPFILGLSAGAGLGVMISFTVAHFADIEPGWFTGTTMPALFGALGALAVVYALGQRGGWLDPISVLLVGVVVSTICGAGIMFCQHLVPEGIKADFTVWLMGHVPEKRPGPMIGLAGGIIAAGIAAAAMLGRAMDVAAFGDDEARSVGLSIGPLRLTLFALAGALTAVTVALAGPIGFVGLIGPHAARLVLGPRHTMLVFGSALAGVTLVVGSDAVRQAIDVGGGRLPIGIFTAFVGGPAFIWLLLRGRAAS